MKMRASGLHFSYVFHGVPWCSTRRCSMPVTDQRKVEYQMQSLRCCWSSKTFCFYLYPSSSYSSSLGKKRESSKRFELRSEKKKLMKSVFRRKEAIAKLSAFVSIQSGEAPLGRRGPSLVGILPFEFRLSCSQIQKFNLEIEP